MLAVRNMLLTSAIVLFVLAVLVILYDLWLTRQAGNSPRRRGSARWCMTIGLLSLAWAPMLFVVSMILIPVGTGASVPQTQAVAQQDVRSAGNGRARSADRRNSRTSESSGPSGTTH